ncbi:MAG: hypothetical protein HY658_01865 [Actinobacteria bacterium]|nr:hypothetical protein [Actinomycetota bacterium]
MRPILVAVILALLLGACARLSSTEAGAGDPGTGDAGASEPVGCGQSPAEVPADADPDDPVSYTPCDDDPGAIDPGPTPVTPRPGMVDVRAREFDSVEVSDDGLTLTVAFYSGVEPCYVLDRVEVEEAAGSVTVTLYEGHEPGDEDFACIEIAVYKSVAVSLDEPLGDREVVDGAAPRE